ncbi:DNA N-6-adenine-methyltransferase [Brasilonema sp. UFV-L1]|uniref:DNA N-6-adenine-methyltransferase n=1 Tax=Brasilonema sp. UFV-L1 TaxID=2234130 RepID=UPI00145FCD95|nr:DNA N-6-adenine-methyltransferase [Brasilonema sp. UFV-L1]NMG11868.1 hypothetical protein [Brasilonema sp. UFV-L1]
MATATEAKTEKLTPVWNKVQGGYILSIDKVDGKFFPSLKKGEEFESFGLFNNESDAKAAILEAYHSKVQDLEPGQYIEVDVDLLYVHPKNKAIYVNDTFEDLIRSLDVADPYIAPLEITSTGRIVAGNRRKKTIDIINQRYQAANLYRKIPRVPVVVKEYLTEEEELSQLILNNQSRKKTHFVRAQEALLLRDIQESKARKLKAIARRGIQTEEDAKLVAEREEMRKRIGKDGAVRSSDVIAQLTGFGSGTAVDNSISGSEYVNFLQKEGHEELAQVAKELMDKYESSSFDAELTKVPLHLLGEIGQELLQSSKKRVNLGKIVEQKQAEKIRQEAEKKADASDTVEARIELSISLKDKPEDNRFTPKILVESGIKVLGEIELDPCAPYVDEVKPIPAKNFYTIKDDALTKDWHGKIFTNFPFSKQPRFFQKLDEQISAAHTLEGIVVCEGGAIFAQKSQEVMAKHKMVMCLYRGRVEFEKGAFYKAIKEANKTQDDLDANNNRSTTAIIYYGARTSAFIDEFSQYGDIRLSFESVLEIQSQQLGLPTWEKGKGGSWYTTFRNNKLEVKKEGDFWHVLIDGEVAENTAHSDRFGKALALAYCIDPSARTPF